MNDQLISRAADSLRALDDRPVVIRQQLAFHVPGRIEFLGKHTDYAGGRSLVCAVDRGIAIVARPRSDSIVRVHDALRVETVELSLDPDLVPNAGHWSTYPAVVARRIARNFPGARRGADLAFASDLPMAAGMSSSSALVIAIYLALEAVNDLPARDDYQRAIGSRTALAEYLGAMENGRDFGRLLGDAGVGTLSGSQDQAAILLSEEGALVQFAFCPLRAEGRVALPRDSVFVIAASGVLAEKGASAQEKYNAVSRKAIAAVHAWRQHTGREDATLGDALRSSVDAAAKLDVALASAGGEFTPGALRDRVAQYAAEAEVIIPAARQALEMGNMERLADLVARSMDGADILLGNQVPETRWLAQWMREAGLPASAFGAGFGGSVWSLVPATRAEALLASWRAAYLAAFPTHSDGAEFFITRAGPPAGSVPIPQWGLPGA